MAKQVAKKVGQRVIHKQYSRREILESLVYELKPFVIGAIGLYFTVHFSSTHDRWAKAFSLALIGCGAFILYWRAKDRGVIE